MTSQPVAEVEVQAQEAARQVRGGAHQTVQKSTRVQVVGLPLGSHSPKVGSGSKRMMIGNGQIVFDDKPTRDQVVHIHGFGEGECFANIAC